MAAQSATEKIIGLDEAEQVKDVLKQMNADATETEERGTALADGIEGKKTAILEKARETKSKGSDMLKTYIDSESDALDGFEFLTMAEAGEAGPWQVLAVLAKKNESHRRRRVGRVGAADPAASLQRGPGELPFALPLIRIPTKPS
jgi:hypothetical protein